MKINDIKAFCSTDRKCHVATVSNGSKDGFVSLIKIDGKSFVSIKGDRGRPSTVAPALIESITWHSKVVLAEGAKGKPAKETTKVVKAVEKKDRKFKPLRHHDDAPKESGKATCGCTGKLKCKEHAAAAGWINGGSTAYKATLNTMDGMSNEELMKVVQYGAALLAKRAAK